VRSYRRLADLVERHDADGAERHWRTHMEAARHVLLVERLGAVTVLDLFH
jgi:DNA-binding FadR family transcriptional regulator